MAIFSIAGAILASAGFTGAITIAGLSPALSNLIIQGVKFAGWSLVGQAVSGGNAPSRQEVQAVINQSRAARVRGYGTFRLGGTRAFFEAAGGVLHQVVVFHHGPIDGVEGFVVDGKRVLLDSSGKTITGAGVPGVTDLFDSFDGKVRILSDTDGVAGGDYADLRTAFPMIWTSQHILQGLCTYYVRLTNPGLERLSKVFPKQANTAVQVDARLSRIYDPRSDEVGFSDNAGLCVLDYLTSPDGWGFASSLIDMESFSQFADICDEPVSLKDGGAEPRYRTAGFYSLEEPRKQVLQRLLATCDGQVYQTAEGRIAVLGGKYSAPDFTLTDEDILTCKAEFGRDPFQDFNVFKGIYTSAAHNFEDQECAPLEDSAAIASVGRNATTIEVPLCPSPSQMQRLLKSAAARSQPFATLSVTTNLVGMKARFPKGDGIHTIRVQSERMSIDGVFEVRSHSYSVQDKTCFIELAAIEDVWGWDAETEEGEAPTPLDALEGVNAVDVVPTGLLISQEVISINATTQGVQLVAQVDDPDRDDLQLVAEVQKVGSGVWTQMNAGIGALRAVSGVVSDGGDYIIRVRWAGNTNLPNGEADYPSGVITVFSNPVAPAAPTAITAQQDGTGVLVSWQNPASNYARTRVFRNDVDSFSGSSAIATKAGDAGLPDSFVDADPPSVAFYWLVALNESDVSSGPSDSVSVTLA